MISKLEHRDIGSDILVSNTLETIDTASDQSINIKGTGAMVGIPAVYSPDAIISIISAQQFCEERHAIIMFLQDGAIGLKLNLDIINCLNKIREIAIKNI